MDIVANLSQSLKIAASQVAAALQLLEDGNTLPFIARYRKEVTGGLDEEQLRLLQESWKSLKALQERRTTIVTSLQEQGVWDDSLARQVQAARTLTELEDLYLPYRPKRKTRATVAREKGLQGLADLILAQPVSKERRSLEQLVQPFLKDGLSLEEVLSGACDIVAETVAETAAVRQRLREKAMRFGRLRSQRAKGEDPKSVFATYYQFGCMVGMLKPHQTLAIDRGEQEKVLSVALDLEERDWREVLSQHFRAHPQSPLAGLLGQALEDGAQRLLLPAIERDVRRSLSEAAHAHAIDNFATNLRALLSGPPLNGHVVLGLDPGFRTGCKLAVVDATGKVLATETVYLHREAEMQASLNRLVERWKVSLIAIGNGTASRESEQVVAKVIAEQSKGLAYLMVSEAGASVYSASPLARAELPDLDVTLRGAVSIARRVQDPLAELVKIDPRSIGVGMYQHDLEAKKLDTALAGVVESVVNRVGVDLNTASPALLTHVAGIGPKLAEKIVAHRDAQGPFRERQALRKVAGLGPKAFEQSAGFLRVRGGPEAFDASAIHPESYATAKKLLARANTKMQASSLERETALRPLHSQLPQLSQELGVGQPTLADILEQLVRPGRDPREDLPPPILRQDVLSLDDLQIGQQLSGTVRNVVDFGSFVDIGVKQDGLLHRSQMPRGSRLEVGQVIAVEILEVDRQRGRISLGWASKHP